MFIKIIQECSEGQNFLAQYLQITQLSIRALQFKGFLPAHGTDTCLSGLGLCMGKLKQ